MRGQRGMTLVELLVMITIACILIAIGSVQLVRARSRGNEASAVASLRVIAQGQLTYSVACGAGGFAKNLPILAQPMRGTSEPFVPPELSATMTTLKTGYYFTVREALGAVAYKVDCHGMQNTTGYYASARPVSYGISGGTQSYAVGLPGVIWALNAAAPPTEPFGPPAFPLR
jgi:prepilin-type N-terminal cleavage/methylation domain-containing protein